MHHNKALNFCPGNMGFGDDALPKIKQVSFEALEAAGALIKHRKNKIMNNGRSRKSI